MPFIQTGLNAKANFTGVEAMGYVFPFEILGSRAEVQGARVKLWLILKSWKFGSCPKLLQQKFIKTPKIFQMKKSLVWFLSSEEQVFNATI